MVSRIKIYSSWWRHQIFALLAICAGNSAVTGEFPDERPVTRSFDVFYLRLNKRLSKQWPGWWSETPSRSLWRHCNVHVVRHESISYEICTRVCIFCGCITACYGFVLSIYPYFSVLLHWHRGNHMIAPLSVKLPWRMWVTSTVTLTIKHVRQSVSSVHIFGDVLYT